MNNNDISEQPSNKFPEYKKRLLIPVVGVTVLLSACCGFFAAKHLLASTAENNENAVEVKSDVLNFTEAQNQIFKFSADGKTVIGLRDTRVAEINIPEGIAAIGDKAFAGCRNLTAVTIPDSVISIGNKAFWCCSNLQKVRISNRVKELGNSAFAYCIKLSEINLPEGVATVGDRALCGVRSVKVAEANPVFKSDKHGVLFDIKRHKLLFFPRKFQGNYTISAEVTAIANDAFGNVENVEFSSQSPFFKVDEFGALIDTRNNKFLYLPRQFKGNYTIPDGVAAIGEVAFEYCKNLTGITIPDSVTVIGKYAFAECKNLKTIDFGQKVSVVGDCAFRSCENVREVVLPDSVTSIGFSAFEYCESLIRVSVPDGVKRIEAYAFNGCPRLKSVSIPKNCTVEDRVFSERCEVVRR